MHPKAPLALGAALLVAIHNATPALSVSDYALIFVAIAYTVSLVRDIRPIRALRKENADLRGQLADCQRDLDETKRKLDEQSQRFEVLEKSRDFKAAFDESLRALENARAATSAEHQGIATVLGQVERGLAAKTAVISTLAAGINAGTFPPAQAKEA
jgi:septal ring factor EnvC (AmiA/AmiB activator)